MTEDRLADIKMWRALIYPADLPPEAKWVDTDLHTIDWLVGEVERLKGLLRQLEWAGCFGCETSDERDRWPACPACGAENPPYGAAYDTTARHAPDCGLAAEL